MDDELQSELGVAEPMPMDNGNDCQGQRKTGIIITYVSADVCASNMETQLGTGLKRQRKLHLKPVLLLCRKNMFWRSKLNNYREKRKSLNLKLKL